MKELTLTADVENLPAVLELVKEVAAGTGLSERDKFQIEVAVEEIFVNISILC